MIPIARLSLLRMYSLMFERPENILPLKLGAADGFGILQLELKELGWASNNLLLAF